jgi:FtsH-binding integral membrane protein
MNQYETYADDPRYMLPAAEAAPNARAAFLKNVYLHLFGAAAACTALTSIFMSTPAFNQAVAGLFGVRFGGLILIIGFIALNWLAASWAHNRASRGVQYAGLGLTVAAHAFLFALLLPFAERVAPGVSQSAAVVTLAIFATLTAVVFYTGTNFNFLAPILGAAIVAALVASVLNIFLGSGPLGPWFAAAMIVVASGYILYDTSRIMREYPADAHIGASLELFTSVAMLFWYVVRLLMQLKDGD